jgi:hypothetical protein
LQEEARQFIEAQFGGGGFLALHWRRGDRAYRAEMGLDGLVDTTLTTIDRVIDFTAAAMDERGLRNVFVGAPPPPCGLNLRPQRPTAATRCSASG